MSALRLGGVAFLGSERQAASIVFRPGVNVICGASETGKSFIVETIDFMLGGRPPLRDIPERARFDRIRMVITCVGWPPLGLERSAEGGGFLAYEEELLEGRPTSEPRTLRQSHQAAREDTLSHVLLERVQLSSKKIRKNRRGETSSLSFRNLARLCVVTEEEIQRRGSPLLSDQYTQRTADYSVFKLLLTGTDDSALVSNVGAGAKPQSLAGKLQLLDQLITEVEDEIETHGLEKAELEGRLERLQGELAAQNEALVDMQARLDEILGRRADMAKEIEIRGERMTEIDQLLRRFELLDRHYRSDLRRLEAIQESGSMFVHLERDTCPLCGAERRDQHLDADCDGNAEELVSAAGIEMEKVRQLDDELADTVAVLRREAEEISVGLPALQEQYDELDARLSEVAAPALSSERASYDKLVSARADVVEAVRRFAHLEKLVRQREELVGSDEGVRSSAADSGTEVAASTLDALAQRVQRILTEWHYPNAERVYFNETARDFEIDGKKRGSTGKGLRAITHAAVNVGLLEYCLDEGLPHPGFLVLDSPLLAYWEPEGEEDDLTGTDLKEMFYQYLLGLRSDVQVVVVENERPPDFVFERGNVNVFTKNPHRGRYGFFSAQGAASGGASGHE